MSKNKRHRAVITAAFDRPVLRSEAARLIGDALRGRVEYLDSMPTMDGAAGQMRISGTRLASIEKPNHLHEAAGDLLAEVKRFRQTCEFYASVDAAAGDDKGAALKRMSMHMLDELIASAEGSEPRRAAVQRTHDSAADETAAAELQEIADGAFGDDPATRGRARDELARRQRAAS